MIGREIMDIYYLRTFREVAKQQSFTRAAEILGYAQSSVTTQIQRLEEEFETSLFERYGRKIRLTDSGEELLRYSTQILALLDEVKENLSEQTQLTGMLNIGTVESLAAFFLPPHLQALRREHPRIKLFLQPGICRDLIQGVKNGTFDIAIIMDRQHDDPDLICHVLKEEQLVLIGNPDHPLATQEQMSIHDLEGETMIVTEEGCSYRDMLERVIQQNGVKTELSYEFGSLEAIKQCVSYGLGVSILPRLAVKEEVKQGKLVILSFTHPDIRVFRQIVYHRKKRISKAFQYFLNLLENDL